MKFPSTRTICLAIGVSALFATNAYVNKDLRDRAYTSALDQASVIMGSLGAVSPSVVLPTLILPRFIK